MPKRKVIDVDDLKVENVPCILMGGSKLPVPIPLLSECGVTCVAINSTDVWLNKVVGDRIRSDKHFVIKNFIAGVLSALSDSRSAEEDVPTVGTPIADKAARRLAAGEKVSAMAMALEDDSDVEDLCNIPMEEDKEASARVRGQERCKGAEFRTVTFRGLELSVKARDKGRGVAVPLEGGSLETVLRHLREQVQGGDAVSSSSVGGDLGESARRRRRVVLESRDDVDGGRVRWLFSLGCYQVWYKADDGKLHQTSRGLRVTRDDPLGQPLSGAVFKKAKALALHKARALWNECDRSSAARYPEIIPEDCR